MMYAVVLQNAQEEARLADYERRLNNQQQNQNMRNAQEDDEEEQDQEDANQENETEVNQEPPIVEE